MLTSCHCTNCKMQMFKRKTDCESTVHHNYMLKRPGFFGFPDELFMLPVHKLKYTLSDPSLASSIDFLLPAILCLVIGLPDTSTALFSTLCKGALNICSLPLTSNWKLLPLTRNLEDRLRACFGLSVSDTLLGDEFPLLALGLSIESMCTENEPYCLLLTRFGWRSG